MRTILPITLFSFSLCWCGSAEAYELVEVLSGDTILVTEDSVRIRLELAGIWVPSPPGPGLEAQYRGAEARKFAEQILLTTPAYIKEVGPWTPKETTRKVRIRVGEDGELDLAVLLADAGLGLVVRTDATDPEHIEAIHQAERDARRGLRGMHDGGYPEFAAHVRRTELDLGIGVLSGERSSGGRSGIQSYLARRRRSIEQRQGGSQRAGNDFGIHETGTRAIRDWGSRMGLPRDASSSGR